MNAINNALRKTMGVELKRVNNAKLTDAKQLAMHERTFSEDSLRDRRLYNVGAGSFSHPYWTNVDYDSDWYADNRSQTKSGLQYDLFSLAPIPVESGTAEVVYTSHTVEHISDAAASNLFAESFRMLKTGGVFRMTTPNIELELRALRANDREYFYWIDTYSDPAEMARVGINKPMREASTSQLFLHHFATSASELAIDNDGKRVSDAQLASWLAERGDDGALDACTALCPLELQRKYPGRHCNWWSFAKADRMLRAAGFTKVYLSAHGQSACPVLRNTALFDSTHPKISLYVEAVR